MQVVEKFISINGEGARAGELAAFIRFKGCNMVCSYCDTAWANVDECPYEEMSPQEIADFIRDTGVANVTLTGGEPLLQPEMKELLRLLHGEGSPGPGDPSHSLHSVRDDKPTMSSRTEGSESLRVRDPNAPPSLRDERDILRELAVRGDRGIVCECPFRDDDGTLQELAVRGDRPTMSSRTEGSESLRVRDPNTPPQPRVEIETNGSVDIAPFCDIYRPVFTLDYKLPSSGCEDMMRIPNFALLNSDDTVKFVCGSMDDLERAREIIEQYDLTRKCNIYLSPVFGKIEPADMVEYMVRQGMTGVRLQVQLHKVIWDPEAQGV